MNILLTYRFLVSLGVRIDRLRLLRAGTLVTAGCLAAPLAALVLSWLVDGILAGRSPIGHALTVAVLLVGQLMLGHFAHLDYYRLAELQERRLRAEMMTLVNGPPHINHLDDATFSDRLALVREDLGSLTHTLESTLQLIGALLQIAVGTLLLAALNPLLLPLPLLAVPPVLIARRAQRRVEQAREQCAEARRRHEHLVQLGTAGTSIKDLRLSGAADHVLALRQDAWAQIDTIMRAAERTATVLRASGQLFFALGYGAGILLVVRDVLNGRSNVGDLLLVLLLTVQLNGQVSQAMQSFGLVQRAGETVRRITYLRSVSDADAAAPTAPRPTSIELPQRIADGIDLEGVSFCYPGSDRPVLHDISLRLPAGRTVALVGENGAGKSTLIKLLCGLYRPTAGRILADGIDVAAEAPAEWRSRIAVLFQDFYRFEFTLRESIGLGDVPRIEDTDAVRAAVVKAHAESVVASTPQGLDGYVGHGYTDGVELSGGQWQTVGLARCMMRSGQALLVLDEPAAALDLAAERRMFDHYTLDPAASADVTVLISHRFSTVRTADLIVVLDAGRVAQVGTHDELMSAGGLYAELFLLQTRAYAEEV
ncbi:MAG: ABC transporter ATP-binding protein [Umezawaea sp.]